MEHEKIATSFCSFESLVREYTYVDKTDMLWRLVGISFRTAKRNIDEPVFGRSKG